MPSSRPGGHRAVRADGWAVVEALTPELSSGQSVDEVKRAREYAAYHSSQGKGPARSDQPSPFSQPRPMRRCGQSTITSRKLTTAYGDLSAFRCSAPARVPSSPVVRV